MPDNVVPLHSDGPDVAELVERFAARYSNPKTAYDYRRVLIQLFERTGRRHPSDLTEADLVAWCTASGPANNTVYYRVSRARVFLRWCWRNGITPTDRSQLLTGEDSPLRAIQPTYGKVQAKNPGRWLTRDEAFGQLIGACHDGTVLGLRDGFVVRLGLLGMRANETRTVTVRSFANPPHIQWTGKRSKPRKATAGQALTDVLARYLDAYAAGLGHPPAPDAPLICRQIMGATRRGGPRRLDWGHAGTSAVIFYAVNDRAKLAGLGHVAPHDLRRTAAGILHHSTDENGKHDFDLLDIQKALGHSDPATTMRSYLDPLDTDVIDRAASFLD